MVFEARNKRIKGARRIEIKRERALIWGTTQSSRHHQKGKKRRNRKRSREEKIYMLMERVVKTKTKMKANTLILWT